MAQDIAQWWDSSIPCAAIQRGCLAQRPSTLAPSDATANLKTSLSPSTGGKGWKIRASAFLLTAAAARRQQPDQPRKLQCNHALEVRAPGTVQFCVNVSDRRGLLPCPASFSPKLSRYPVAAPGHAGTVAYRVPLGSLAIAQRVGCRSTLPMLLRNRAVACVPVHRRF